MPAVELEPLEEGAAEARPPARRLAIPIRQKKERTTIFYGVSVLITAIVPS